MIESKELKHLPLISIVIPVYNCEDYLEECIDSVINQNYPELEIILVDDGSTDNSGKICDTYVGKYNDKKRTINVIHKENGGACFARRDGLSLSKADYVAFVDGDDYIDSDFCINLMTDILQNDAEVATSGFVYTSTGTGYMDSAEAGLYAGEKKETLNNIMIYEPISEMGGIIMSVCGKIYKKELFLKSIQRVKIRLELFEDLAYCYGPLIEAQSVYVEHNAYYHYRNNPNSVTRKEEKERLRKTQQSFMFERQIYDEYGQKYLNQFDFVATKFYYCNLWQLSSCDLKSIKLVSDEWARIKNEDFVSTITNNAYKKGMGRKYDFFIKTLRNNRLFWLYCYFMIKNMVIELKKIIRSLINGIAR